MGEYADLYDEQSLVQELYGMEDPDDIFDEWGIPCLLYTSPSPRDSILSRMPSSA